MRDKCFGMHDTRHSTRCKKLALGLPFEGDLVQFILQLHQKLPANTKQTYKHVAERDVGVIHIFGQ